MAEEDEDWGWEGAFEPIESRHYALGEKIIWWAIFASLTFVGLLGMGTAAYIFLWLFRQMILLWRGGC